MRARARARARVDLCQPRQLEVEEGLVHRLGLVAQRRRARDVLRARLAHLGEGWHGERRVRAGVRHRGIARVRARVWVRSEGWREAPGEGVGEGAASRTAARSVSSAFACAVATSARCAAMRCASMSVRRSKRTSSAHHAL